MSRKSMITALCIISLCSIPLAGMARMSALTDDQLSEVVGQAGFVIDPGTMSLDPGSDYALMGDFAGLGLFTRNGIISLSDVTLQGSVTIHDPITISPVTDLPVSGTGGLRDLTGASSVDINIGHVSMDIDRYSIGAIYPGPVPGEGPSLGSFEMSGHVSVSGSVRISTR